MTGENHGYQLSIVSIVCYVSAVIGVSLRFYVRQYIVGKLGHEDWMMAVGLALYTIYTAFAFVGLHYGTGRHHRDLSDKNIQMAIKYWYFCEWSYALTTATIKYAVGVFYLRIMIRPWQQNLVKLLILGIIFFSITYFACVVAQCVPVPYIWRRYAVPETYQGSCLPDAVILWGTYLHSILSASVDWTLGLLPITLMWNAKMTRGTKVMMCLVLGLGAIASTSTLVRLSTIHNITHRPDFLWDTLGIAIWSTVEPGVALLAAGLATIRPLLRSLFPNLFSSALIPEVPSTEFNGTADCDRDDWIEPRTLSTHNDEDDSQNQKSKDSVSTNPPVLPQLEPLTDSQLAADGEMVMRSPFPFPAPPMIPGGCLKAVDGAAGGAGGERGMTMGGFGAGMGNPSSQLPAPESAPGQMMGFGAGVCLVPPTPAFGSTFASVGGAHFERNNNEVGTGLGVNRAKSWRSVTTAKTGDSRATRDGYGNITIAYADAAEEDEENDMKEEEKAKEVLGMEMEMDREKVESNVESRTTSNGVGNGTPEVVVSEAPADDGMGYLGRELDKVLEEAMCESH